MQPSVQARPSSTSSSFAGLLAALASPRREKAERAEAWTGDELGEDVATLSYERALRAHARYKPADRGDGPWAQAADRLMEPAGVGSAAETSTNKQAVDQDLRSASVTIRLSQAECTRLHQRAAEAGVTVSAYLRSCTFEVEALRGQVKEVLAELRTAGSKGAREQGSNKTAPRKKDGVSLTRIIGHIGNLWLGFSNCR